MYKKQIVLLILVSLGLASALPSHAAPTRHTNAQQHAPVKILPKGHHAVSHKGKSYFYSAGRFYRKANGSYVVINAPIGVVVPVLPDGYVSFGIGINRFFYFQGIYYRHRIDGYEVIEEPPQAQQALASGSDKMIIYPAGGQTVEQLDRDKYECHVWAVEEASFDPTDPNSDPLLRADYQRAMGACMEARNYVVR